jgi:hypothetical protein
MALLFRVCFFLIFFLKFFILYSICNCPSCINSYFQVTVYSLSSLFVDFVANFQSSKFTVLVLIALTFHVGLDGFA